MTEHELTIDSATPSDLPAIRATYTHARQVQLEQGSIQWPEFTDEAILTEIREGRLYRVMDAGALVGIFSVTYDDGAIWGELERGEHIYLHRIARTANYAGKGMVAAVLAWARAHCVTLGRAGLRMDTWANNDGLIAYYERHGFHVVGVQRLGADPRLAAHYHGNEFTLLEELRTSESR